jgi:hypothetical protein
VDVEGRINAFATWFDAHLGAEIEPVGSSRFPFALGRHFVAPDRRNPSGDPFRHRAAARFQPPVAGPDHQAQHVLAPDPASSSGACRATRTRRGGAPPAAWPAVTMTFDATQP